LSARTKLNAIAIVGSILIAAVVGVVFESWIAFLITAAGLIALAVHEGGIRPDRRKR
jgi:Na+(H+)/acetate symporter ActP